MALTRAGIATKVGYTLKRTDKDTEVSSCLQWVLDDIGKDFFDSEELKTSSAELSLTSGTATLDTSSLTDLMGTWMEHIELIDSSAEENNADLKEITFDEYIKELPDPTDITNASKGYPEEYARRGDTLYFYPVPNQTTLSVKIYYTKIHPTTGDIQYPDIFEHCIVTGVLYMIFDILERFNESEVFRVKYEGVDGMGGLKRKLISQYKAKPNLEMRADCFF